VFLSGKACIKKVLLSNCLQELMELHQESEEEVTDTEQAENWFSLTSAQRICDMFLALDKDMNGTLSKQELREYADGTLTEIFIERGRKQHQFLHIYIISFLFKCGFHFL
jgi:serine/threonine-protein phosphatase 2A regulatory subunit B''